MELRDIFGNSVETGDSCVMPYYNDAVIGLSEWAHTRTYCRILPEKGAAYLDLYNNQRMEVYTNGDLRMQYPNLVAREHGDIFDDYLRHAEQGTPLVGAGVLDGLRTIELAYAAYDALREGHTVRVKRHLEEQNAG